MLLLHMLDAYMRSIRIIFINQNNLLESINIMTDLEVFRIVEFRKFWELLPLHILHRRQDALPIKRTTNFNRYEMLGC